jgi:hypothetical protein
LFGIFSLHQVAKALPEIEQIKKSQFLYKKKKKKGEEK